MHVAPIAVKSSPSRTRTTASPAACPRSFSPGSRLLASTPAFNALQSNYDPNVIRPKDYGRLNPEQKRQFHEFWNKLNEEYDDRSIPKSIGKKLLDLHIARGDAIYIISRRPESQPRC